MEPSISQSQLHDLHEEIKAFRQLVQGGWEGRDVQDLTGKGSELIGKIQTVFSKIQAEGGLADYHTELTQMLHSVKDLTDSMKESSELKELYSQLKGIYEENIGRPAPNKQMAESSHYFQKHFEISQARREAKLKELQEINPEAYSHLNSQLIDLRERLTSFESDFVELNDIREIYNQDKTNTVAEDSFFGYKDIVEKGLTELKDKFPEFSEEIIEFSDRFFVSHSIEDIQFAKEILFNGIINSQIYKISVNDFVLNNKELIISQLQSGKEPLFSSLEHVDVSVDYIGMSEGHNSGKRPLLVKFQDSQNPALEFKAVIKPRNAAIDKAVIETFNEINDLADEEKSDKDPLPTYRIIDPSSSEGWSSLDKVGEISLWEFVEGKSVAQSGRAQSAYTYIHETLKRNSPASEATEAKLDRLNKVLYEMGIGDLHSENIIVQKKEGTLRFIPIDLEVRYRDREQFKTQGTRLGKVPEKFSLTAQENKIIHKFNKRAVALSVRVLPASTMTLMCLLASADTKQGFNKLCQMMTEELSTRYNLDKQKIEEYLYQDVLNKDIPYFTEKNGKLYYGLSSENRIIGEIK